MPWIGEARILTETSYTALGQVDESVDGREVRTKNHYDTQGRLVKVDQAFGTGEVTSTSYVYDKNGQRVKEIDESGLVTNFRYDGAGRLIRTTYPDGSFTSTAFDAAGRVTATSDRLERLTRFEYDAAGRQVAVIDALNHRSETEYNADGSVRLTRDAANRETEQFYDGLGRCIRTRYADGTETRTEYEEWPNYYSGDLNGRIERQFDQLDRKTEFHYDFAGRLLEVHQWKDKAEQNDPDAAFKTMYEYDVRGNRTKQTDALGRETIFEYDALGRLREKEWPGGTDVESYFYDGNGNLARKITPMGEEIVYSYDLHNRLIGKEVDEEPSYEPWEIVYTPSGQRESVTRGDDVWQWTYEPLTNRLKTFTDPAGRSIDYGYDRNGSRTSVTTSQGTTRFEYDELGRLTKVTDRLAGVMSQPPLNFDGGRCS